MVWIPGESIFDRLLSFKSPKAEYYHCQKTDTEAKYECKMVQGAHRVIQVYPDVPESMHLQILEGVLNAPVNITK
jgi:hypothetical protein